MSYGSLCFSRGDVGRHISTLLRISDIGICSFGLHVADSF